MGMQCSSFRFEVLAECGNARKGRFHTARGRVDTPAFMPVGTQGTVKAITPESLKRIGAQIILSNTYHLHLRPGEELIENLGGLHKFMAWDGPILTDSGGYQVFSLAKLRKLTDEGIVFQSHIDGSKKCLTPEKAIEIQEKLASDIMMVLDECVPYPCDEKDAAQAVERTSAWAERCLNARKTENALFGIVQGSTYKNLREQSSAEICEKPLDGIAVGGLSVGEGHDKMMEVLDYTAPLLPKDKPHYLMGVGTPLDIVEAVARGIDMFDCVLPTRNARNGQLFTWKGKITLKQTRFRFESGPPDENCTCYTCSNFSLAYLRHLFISGEILSSVLATIHNLHFYLELMLKIRHSVENQYLNKLRSSVKEMYND
jgi:queuine tRNA-ribosyltransferase